MARNSRNKNVEQTVDKILSVIDDYLQSDVKVSLPQPAHRRAIDTMISTKGGSVRLATLFLLFYWTLDSFLPIFRQTLQ